MPQASPVLSSPSNTDESSLAAVLAYPLQQKLASADPYDIWKTRLGFRVKGFYHRHPRAGLAFAAVLTLLDLYARPLVQRGYRRQEYPIARALAALTLLNLYPRLRDAALLPAAQRHLDWLLAHRCSGLRGYGWGLGFDYAVDRDFSYDADTPFATMTPYALEGFVAWQQVTGDHRYADAIRGIGDFFLYDLKVMRDGADGIAISYTPMRDRVVINASSYALYAHALIASAATDIDAEPHRRRARDLYRFVRANQQPDGSWYYALAPRSFIDCFHSCIVIKNLHKAAQWLTLPGVEAVIDRGWDFVKRRMRDPKTDLFRRFAVANKPGIIRYDLYDNAEAMALAHELGDCDLAADLEAAIRRHFVTKRAIYSQIDVFGLRHNPDTLRWAVMPYVHALSLRAAGRGYPLPYSLARTDPAIAV